MRRLPFLASTLGAVGAITLGGCADEPTRPPNASGATQSLGLSAEARGRLHGAVLFAREHSIRALDRRDAADALSEALAAVAERVDRDDRAGLQRAVAAARKAVDHYRAIIGPDDPSSIDLEAVTLALEHAATLGREADAVQSADNSRTNAHTRSEDR